MSTNYQNYFFATKIAFVPPVRQAINFMVVTDVINSSKTEQVERGTAKKTGWKSISFCIFFFTIKIKYTKNWSWHLIRNNCTQIHQTWKPHIAILEKTTILYFYHYYFFGPFWWQNWDGFPCGFIKSYRCRFLGIGNGRNWFFRDF